MDQNRSSQDAAKAIRLQDRVQVGAIFVPLKYLRHHIIPRPHSHFTKGRMGRHGLIEGPDILRVKGPCKRQGAQMFYRFRCNFRMKRCNDMGAAVHEVNERLNQDGSFWANDMGT